MLAGLAAVVIPGLACKSQPSPDASGPSTEGSGSLDTPVASYASTRRTFLDVPLAERRTMPLFFLHDETDARLVDFVNRIARGGNGSFIIESRPHHDWLGPGWYDDLRVILNHAKTKNMGGWIFDERWWPSLQVAGRVPAEHRVRKLLIYAVDATGPTAHAKSGHSGDTYVKTVAGKLNGTEIDADSLIDLSPYISAGELRWPVPAGTWRIMKFTWSHLTDTDEQCDHTDMLTQSAVDWFVAYAIKPHYDNIGATNVKGFFYDEPSFSGAANWGVGMESDTPYWKEMLVGWFYPLTGEAAGKAKYLYYQTLIERYGRVGLGTYRSYVNSQGGKLTGHWIEEDAWHDNSAGLTLNHGAGGALNLMELEKHQDIPGMDLTSYYEQMPSPGTTKNWSTYQLPKMISSISIINHKEDHLAMVEIFGAAGQQLSYEDMKWWGDWAQVKGVNVMVPHSFNTRGSVSDPDPDNPPFFYYDGDRANWPKYDDWCQRQNRLSYMLSGNDDDNYSFAPVAVLWTGYSKYADNYVDYKEAYPFNLESALDRVHYDHNLLTYDSFENTATLDPSAKRIRLHNSSYGVLITSPVQHIPYETLHKAKQFYDQGGTVVGWQRVPTRSATFGHADSEVQAISKYLWGSLTPPCGASPINANANGGKTYFIAATDETTIRDELAAILSDAGVESDLRILDGVFDDFTAHNHRKKNGLDVFMVWNGSLDDKPIVARLTATGTPEVWNPTTKSIDVADYTRVATNQVDVRLVMPARESLLVVFNPTDGSRLERRGAAGDVGR